VLHVKTHPFLIEHPIALNLGALNVANGCGRVPQTLPSSLLRARSLLEEEVTRDGLALAQALKYARVPLARGVALALGLVKLELLALASVVPRSRGERLKRRRGRPTAFGGGGGGGASDVSVCGARRRGCRGGAAGLAAGELLALPGAARCEALALWATT